MPTFEELHTLITLISEHSQQPLPLLGRLERQPGKESTLFDNIGKGNYRSDEQAAADLYGQATPGKGYAMLKSRLYDKLLNHLFFLDFNDPRLWPSAAKEQECLSYLHRARGLINLNRFDLAEDLLNQALQIATELRLNELSIYGLEASNFICMAYTREKALNKNLEKLRCLRQIVHYEQEAEDVYYLSVMELSKPVEKRKRYYPRLVEVIARLKMLWEQNHSPKIFFFYHRLNIWYQELTGNYQEIIRITEESTLNVRNKLLHPLRFDERYNKYIQVYAYLRIRDYKNGLQLAAAYQPAFHPATNNWFAYMENYVLLAMHAQQYKQAVELLKQVDANQAFNKITKRAKEKWTLYRAYLYFMRPTEELLHHFDYQEFIQSVPGYSKDKQGFNVAILILQFLQDIKTGDVELLVSRIESLKQYAKRHLSDRTAQRSRLFIRLLALISLYWGNAEICRVKGEKLLQQLKITPSPGDAFAEIEIVPYEHLWKWVLSHRQLGEPG